MKEVGKIVHLAKSGRLIVKVDRYIKSGTILFDSKGRKLAKVTEVVGPVKSPYATAIPLAERLETTAGNKVMISNKTRKGVRIGKKK
ncbi:MAG: Gar1/Naf1 family protein [Candidatus Methylarchaceae archaeon HK01B]|nr:Gar1/Naf1 family protein [Candidatus Methylarchaceae archaeon HK01M]MCP8311410.1 Gar1/Naf1 family protein [Candidatus Methylarchaceae archaeon HK02M1]MCP8318336.1 Gar1/Naf1 family protein [Candidatus Methylarchaceae archaeon HK01B]